MLLERDRTSFREQIQNDVMGQIQNKLETYAQSRGQEDHPGQPTKEARQRSSVDREATGVKTRQQTEEARKDAQTDIGKVEGQRVSQEKGTEEPPQGQETAPQAQVEPSRTEKDVQQQEMEAHAKAVEPQWVADLLGNAKRQIVAKRLTTPPEDNALESYQKVLQAIPGHREALRGIDEIKEQYRKLAEESQQKGDQKNAETYRNLALKIDSMAKN